MKRIPNVSRQRALIGFVGLTVSGVLAAACGSTTTSSPGGPSGNVSQPPMVASIASEVPSAIKSNAPLQIAVDATYAPNEFVFPRTGDIQGWDVDLAKAVCRVWGVVCTINNVTFADIIPALLESPAKYVISYSSFTPTTTREGKGIDFVTYYKAGESWLVKTGSSNTITAATDMCGHAIAVESGTTEESDAWGLMGMMPGGTAIKGDANSCQTAGKTNATVLSFDTQTEADAALLTGRADYGFLDTPVAYYQVKVKSGKLKIVGATCGIAPYGVAMAHSSGLQQATVDAIKYLIDHDYYKQLLDSWNVSTGAIASSDVAVNVNASTGAGTQACVPSY
jgi:polar amino acid transport system substrate-binding protein